MQLVISKKRFLKTTLEKHNLKYSNRNLVEK